MRITFGEGWNIPGMLLAIQVAAWLLTSIAALLRGA